MTREAMTPVKETGRCPQYYAREVHFMGMTIGNAVNICRFCGHLYEVTMMMGNYRRSFWCKCCRGKKRKTNGPVVREEK